MITKETAGASAPTSIAYSKIQKSLEMAKQDGLLMSMFLQGSQVSNIHIGENAFICTREVHLPQNARGDMYQDSRAYIGCIAGFAWNESHDMCIRVKVVYADFFLNEFAKGGYGRSNTANISKSNFWILIPLNHLYFIDYGNK